MFSASSETRDRNAPTNANQIRLQTSGIRQEHRPIRYQLPARLSFRQGQVRSKLLPGLDSSVSLFILDKASEIVFSGDAGDTWVSRARRSYGVEWTNTYRPKRWLEFDADLALAHARFVGFDCE